jgi:hypothetical protein
MTDKEFVQQYYPKSKCEHHDPDLGCDIYSGSLWPGFIGNGNTEDEAWSEARKYIEFLPEDQKPKINGNTI